MSTAIGWGAPPLAAGAFFGVLQALFLALHWAAVNVLVGLAFQHAWARRDEVALDRRLAGALPGALALSMILGVGSLAFLHQAHGERFAVAAGHLGAAWIVGGAGLLLAWGAALRGWRRARAGRAAGRGARALVLLGLAAFSYVLVLTISLGEKPEALAAAARGDLGPALAGTGALQRWFHEFLGAIALGSVALLYLAARERAAGGAAAAQWGPRAVRTAFVATGLGVLGGVCTLLKAPSEVGGALPGILLTVGIVAGLAVPFHMHMAWARVRPRLIGVAAGLALGCLVAKAGLRLAIRARRLDGASALEEVAPVGAAALVGGAAAVVGALVLLGWALRWARTPRAR